MVSGHKAIYSLTAIDQITTNRVWPVMINENVVLNCPTERLPGKPALYTVDTYHVKHMNWIYYSVD